LEKSNKIVLFFLVSGETYQVDANINQPLKVARDKALRDADQTGRPLDDWEVRYNGKVMSTSDKIEDLGIPDGAKLEIALSFGAGG